MDIDRHPINVSNNCEKFVDSLSLKFEELGCFNVHMQSYLFTMIKHELDRTLYNYSNRESIDYSKYEGLGDFVFNDEYYSVDISIDSIDSSKINVLVWEKMQHQKPKKLKKYPLNGGKIYQSISYSFEPLLDSALSSFLNCCQTLITEYERWFISRLETINNRAAESIIADWYGLVRSLFPEEVAKNIYLYVFQNKAGIYILDQLKFHDAVDTLAEGAKKKNQDFYDLFYTFSHTTNDFKNIAASVAVPENKTVLVSQNSQFSGHDPVVGMGLAEATIYQDTNLIVQPLMKCGQIVLEAAYPPKFRSEIEEKLKLNAHGFKTRLESNKKVTTLLENRNRIFTVESTGRFLGSFFGAYSKASQ